MEVQMGYGLLPGLADVGHHAVTGLGKAKFLGQLGNDLEDVGHHGAVFRRDRGNRGDMSLGDHQEMGRGRGCDVVKGIAQVILIDLAAGDLPGDNFAE